MRDKPETKLYVKGYYSECSVRVTGVGSPPPFPACLQAFTDSVASQMVTVQDSVTYGKDYPNWKLQLLVGDPTTTSLDGLRYNCKKSAFTYRDSPKPTGPFYPLIRCNTWQAYGHNVNIVPVAIPPASASLLAENRARSALLGSYIKTQTKWRGGNAVAEFAETVRMFARPVKGIYSLTWSFTKKVRNLGKIYHQDSGRYAKLLAGAWLTYSFGAKPLASDAQEAYMALEALQQDRAFKDTYRIKGTGFEVSGYSQAVNQSVPNARYAVCDLLDFIDQSVIYTGAVNVRPAGDARFLSNFGLGITDILPAVWEAVPWSWFIDYFLNVGEVLDSTKLLFADVAWLQRTVRNRRVRVTSPIRNLASATTLRDYDVACKGGEGIAETVIVSRRNSGTTIPYPGLHLRTPGLLSTKWLNVAALGTLIASSNPRRASEKVF